LKKDKMKKILMTAVSLGMLAGASSLVRADDMGHMSANRNSSAATSYSARGVVEKITPDLRTATIHTETIRGYMDEMTMDYAVGATNELSGISPGDKINFTLVVSNNTDWIEGIHRTGHSDSELTNNPPAHDTETELGVGDRLPDGALNSEDGREIHFSDFRGKALAFTFFYTRCPLPNYCPLMNRNFADARKLISSKSDAPANWEFLSISFDPATDTPPVLASYGGFYRDGNSRNWLFASAPTNTLAMLGATLDLMVFREGSSISHNLRTVVLDPKGRIYREFDGNEWTPGDLATAVMQAAGR
jgi:protein SCO1/2